MTRHKDIYRITLFGSAINVLLVAAKFIVGSLGHSAALLADAVHSLSDLLSDAIVLVFVHLASRPEDGDHDYGHGKYETLATALVGAGLLAAGAMIMYSGVEKIIFVLRGNSLAPPTRLALVVALLSVALKEIAFRATYRVGTRLQASVVIANAWHHRSDALSSLGATLGIAGALVLGDRWVVLDPLAALVVSCFLLRTAWRLLRRAADELLEKSLSDDIKREIRNIAASEGGVSEVHNLRTRRIGNNIAIEMHIRMPGNVSLYSAHERATEIERLLCDRFGSGTHVIVHVEPLKKDGRYVAPEAQQAD